MVVFPASKSFRMRLCQCLTILSQWHKRGNQSRGVCVGVSPVFRICWNSNFAWLGFGVRAFLYVCFGREKMMLLLLKLPGMEVLALLSDPLLDGHLLCARLYLCLLHVHTRSHLKTMISWGRYHATHYTSWYSMKPSFLPKVNVIEMTENLEVNMHPFTIPEPPFQNYSFAQHIRTWGSCHCHMVCGNWDPSARSLWTQDGNVSAFAQLVNQVPVTPPSHWAKGQQGHLFFLGL